MCHTSVKETCSIYIAFSLISSTFPVWILDIPLGVLLLLFPILEGLVDRRHSCNHLVSTARDTSILHAEALITGAYLSTLSHSLVSRLPKTIILDFARMGFPCLSYFTVKRFIVGIAFAVSPYLDTMAWYSSSLISTNVSSPVSPSYYSLYTSPHTEASGLDGSNPFTRCGGAMLDFR